MEDELTDYMTSRELAAAAGVTPGRIRQLIYSGELSGLKIAGRWFIRRETAAEFLKMRTETEE